jgi:uncharacterized iron-regulated membrane protein
MDPMSELTRKYDEERAMTRELANQNESLRRNLSNLKHRGPVSIRWAVGVTVGILLSLIVLFFIVGFASRAYSRYQRVADANNQIQVIEKQVEQTEMLIDVEEQKAAIRIVEAEGIAEAQALINSTLTDQYLQHEAIGAQIQMANAPNHTTVYIPSGQNGIPIVSTLDPDNNAASTGD